MLLITHLIGLLEFALTVFVLMLLLSATGYLWALLSAEVPAFGILIFLMVSPLLMPQRCAFTLLLLARDTSAHPVCTPHCTAEQTEAWRGPWVVEPGLASDCPASKASWGRLAQQLGLRGVLEPA